MNVLGNSFARTGLASKSAAIQIRSTASIYAESEGRRFGDIVIPTLEGSQVLVDEALMMVCRGVNKELWQQPLNRITKVYDVPANCDFSMWNHCPAKPNAPEVEFMVNTEFTHIRGKWGSSHPVLGENIQTCEIGDMICRSLEDKDDMWVVRRKLFDATYTIKK
jgi:hypothetical protein